ncbi:MAG: hypothetical protein LAP40_02985 [Acidobacteriia bacterium]|nr:hypothetical protein [Terriglobia bacterium]
MEHTEEPLSRQPESYGDQRRKRKPWSRREALGHLIDWATAHDHWFARALADPNLAVSGYPSDDWVTAQRYDRLPWAALPPLWCSMNRLIHVLAQIPEEKLKTPCRIGVASPVPLGDLIAGYVDHCEDVVGQLLARRPG